MSVDHSGWALDCKVYVGGLGSGADKEELEREFREYGALKNVWVARNPPGFAFLEYKDPRDAEDAVRALDGILMNGRRVMVQMSNGKTKPTSKMTTRRPRSESVDSDHRPSRKRHRHRSRSRSYSRSRRRSSYSRSTSTSSSSRSSHSRGYNGRRSRRKSHRTRYTSDSSYGHNRRHRSRRRELSRSSRSTSSASSGSSVSSREYVHHERSPNDRKYRKRMRSVTGNERHGPENPIDVIEAFKDDQSFESMEHTGACELRREQTQTPMEQGIDSCIAGTSGRSARNMKAAVSNEAIDAAVQTDIYLMLHFVRNPDVLSDTFLRLDRDNVLNNCNYPEIIPSVYQRKSDKKKKGLTTNSMYA